MRQLLTILFLLTGLIGAALVVYNQLFKEPEAARVVVVGVSGEARGTLASGERVLMKDDILEERARVSTAEGAELRLKVDEGEEVVIQSGSKVELTSVTREGVDFTLSQGSLEATVKRFRGRKLSVGVEGSSAKVRTSEGAFRAMTDTKGKLDAASLSGKVETVLEGQAPRALPEGQRRLVDASGKVLASGEIPRSVLLQVDWPTDPVVRNREFPVSGKATPGSIVTVEGREIWPENDGSFKTHVTLKEGANQIQVQARGMGAPSTSTSPTIQVDTTIPTLNVGGLGLPKQKR